MRAAPLDCLGLVGEAHWCAGHAERAQEFIDDALAFGDSVGEHLHDAQLHRLRGELIAALSPESLAEGETPVRRATTVAQT